MAGSQPGILYVGTDSASVEAVQIIQDSGVDIQIINVESSTYDFTPPLLINGLGVFDNLDSIRWYGRVVGVASA